MKDRNISVIIDKTFPDTRLMNTLLKKDAKLVMGAYYGEATPDSGVAYRAYKRAETSDNAVDMRFLPTEFLLRNHANYLNNLIKQFDENRRPFNDIVIVDTAGKDLSNKDFRSKSDTGEFYTPVELAIITKNEVKVLSPKFIDFIAKDNMNPNAKHPVELSMKNRTPQEIKDGRGMHTDYKDKIQSAENFKKLCEERGFKVIGMDEAIEKFKAEEIKKIRPVVQEARDSDK